MVSTHLQQDVEGKMRMAHLRKLPLNLLTHVEQRYLAKSPEFAAMKEGDEAAFWLKVASDEDLPSVIDSCKDSSATIEPVAVT